MRVASGAADPSAEGVDAGGADATWAAGVIGGEEAEGEPADGAGVGEDEVDIRVATA